MVRASDLSCVARYTVSRPGTIRRFGPERRLPRRGQTRYRSDSRTLRRSESPAGTRFLSRQL